MRIHSLRNGTEDTRASRLLAGVGGLDVNYVVRGSPRPLRVSYDPFVLTGFMAAMEGDGVLTTTDAGPVSEALHRNLAEASWIYTQWWSDLKGLDLQADTLEDQGRADNEWVASFFSGGVDSLHSYLQNREEITHLILCRGLDISFKEDERWANTVRMVRGFAETEDKGLILIETNAKKLQSPIKARNHGAILISAGLTLGFQKLIVPASVTLDLMLPYGSHPLLDPLFSNGITEVVHDSPIHRTKKIRTIVEAGIGLEQLRVCNVDTDKVNCGRCEKCLRTRTTLGLLEAGSPHLEPLEDPRELRNLRVRGPGFIGAWEENLTLARQLGREDFVQEIRRAIRRFRTKAALMQLDEDVLGGALLKLRRRLQGR